MLPSCSERLDPPDYVTIYLPMQGMPHTLHRKIDSYVIWRVRTCSQSTRNPARSSARWSSRTPPQAVWSGPRRISGSRSVRRLISSVGESEHRVSRIRFIDRPPQEQPKPARSQRQTITPTPGNTRSEKAAEHDGSLISTRSLLILSLATMIGIAAGLSAGIAAGLSAAKDAGTPWAITIGLIAGLSAAVFTGLTVAGTLHLLVSKNPG
jgi:hypothetical protein